MSRSINWRAVGLICALSLHGCGGGEETPIASQPTAGDLVPIILALDRALGELDLVKLLSGETQEVQGIEGRVLVTASEWKFENYSPDGHNYMNGLLRLSGLVPISIVGELELSGPQQGPVQLDLVVDMGEGADDPELSGTVTYGGIRFDLDDVTALAGT